MTSWWEGRWLTDGGSRHSGGVSPLPPSPQRSPPTTSLEIGLSSLLRMWLSKINLIYVSEYTKKALDNIDIR